MEIEFTHFHLRKIGGILFFFGVGSMVLSVINFEFIILMWIDLWGPVVGWTIRIGMAVVGGGLWLVGRARAEEAEE